MFLALGVLAVALLCVFLSFGPNLKVYPLSGTCCSHHTGKREHGGTSLWLLNYLLGNGIYHFHLHLIGQASHMVKADNNGWARMSVSEEQSVI